MLFNAALFSSLLLPPVVLAIPPSLGTRSYTGTQVNNLERATDADCTGGPTYNGAWAGAMWTEDGGGFDTITGTFTVPFPSGSNYASAAAWIGIDGGSCMHVVLQTGVIFTAESNEPTYSAFCQWHPVYLVELAEPSILAGDVIRLTITTSSLTNANTTIENLTNGQTGYCNGLSSSVPLCGQSAEWMVSESSSDTPLANFGTVTFTDATATGNGGITYTPDGAGIADIEQNNIVLTSVSISGDSVVIEYVTQDESD